MSNVIDRAASVIADMADTDPDPYDIARALADAGLRLIDEAAITRLTVVDRTQGGRAQGGGLEKWDVQVHLDVQDEGRTLKVFVTDRTP